MRWSSRSTGLFTGYWLADLCAQEDMPFVLGQALDMTGIPGGKVISDTIDAQNIAVLPRGGLFPQASLHPAARRATRDLLRCRMHVRRYRAAPLTHVQHTTNQDNLPEIERKIAEKANRDTVAERCADPAVPTSLAVDLVLMSHDDERLRDVERSIPTAAQPPDATILSRLHTVLGS